MKGFDTLRSASVSELWRRERHEFRPWIIAAICSYALITILALCIYILRIYYHTDIINNATNFINANKARVMENADVLAKFSSSSIAAQIEWAELVMSTLLTLSFLITTFFFCLSVYRSYQKRDFGLISHWTLTLYLIVAMISIFLLLSSVVFGNKAASGMSSFIFLFDPNTPSGIKAIKGLDLTMMFTITITYAVFIRHVRKIRILFILAKRTKEMVNMLSNYPLPQQEGVVNPYTEFSHYFQRQQRQEQERQQYRQSNKQSTDGQPHVATQKESAEEIKFAYLHKDFIKSDIFGKISKFTREQLDTIAEKLSISGHDELNDEELLQKVLRIYEQEWLERQERGE